MTMSEVILIADCVTAVGLVVISIFTGISASRIDDRLLWGASTAAAVAALSQVVGIAAVHSAGS